MIREIYWLPMQCYGYFRTRRSRRLAAAAAVASCLLPASTALGQYSVAATVHNLSVSGPGEIKSVTETEVCKFCHVPHNALPSTPLWGHAISTVRYEVPDFRADIAFKLEQKQK